MIRIAALLFAFASSANAQELRLPSNAVLTSDETELDVGGGIPTGPWQSGRVPTQSAAGDRRVQTWHIDATGLTTAQLMRNLREQLVNTGLVIVYECETETCGGFDFRFAVDFARPPAMVVNLADFRFVSARDPSGHMAGYAIVSKTRASGYIQLTRIGANDGISDVSADLDPIGSEVTDVTFDVAAQLANTGRAILDGLAFERGSAQLASGSFDALSEVADYLAANPGLQIAMVGHTDSEGSLDGNIQLSKRRAGSVLERLITDYGVSRQQVSAEGMGYLSPIASNLTEAGREANRRVEVIIISNGN